MSLVPHGRLSLTPVRLEAPAFTPLYLRGISSWIRAGDSRNTVAAGAVQTAFDLSGQGRHWITASAGVRPLDTTDVDGRR